MKAPKSMHQVYLCSLSCLFSSSCLSGVSAESCNMRGSTRFKISFVIPRASVKKRRRSRSRMNVSDRVLRTKSTMPPVFIRKERPFQKVSTTMKIWATSMADPKTFQLIGMAQALKRTESRLLLPVSCHDCLSDSILASWLKVIQRPAARLPGLSSSSSSNASSPRSALLLALGSPGASVGTFKRKRIKSWMLNSSAQMATQNTPMHTVRHVADSMPSSTGPMLLLVTFTFFMTS
mmetsp:Transcript_117091/g.326200  ORF Transcript_117091/g.326200 Transcript_117091/m.326200 type:complete len:235 (+) Transcript_117091:430-1134(+)